MNPDETHGAARGVKIRVRKSGCYWFVFIPGAKPDDIPEFLMYRHYTDAFARVQVEIDPRMAAECNRKAKGRT